uniref:Nose resistant to fluoxetine protein 6-like n=1 Tax=Diabrotica virgifera virgifera TaxID=50390 RepID=A0A6P7GYN7_DIAVI
AYIKRLISKISDGVHMVGYPTWALCLPSNCTDEDAKYVMSRSQTLGTGIDSITCQTIEDVNPPLDYAAIIGLSILGIVVLVVIMSTVYDLYCQNKYKEYQQSAYTAFSVYTNGKKLFQVSKRVSPLSCLDGIRVISMIWIVMLHTYSVYTTGPVFNSKDVVNEVAEN